MLKFDEKKLSIGELNLIIKITMELKEDEPQHGAYLAKKLDMTPHFFRRLISRMRKFNDIFLINSFVVSTNKGYFITRNKDLIKEWALKQQKRSNNGLRQVNKAFEVIKFYEKGDQNVSNIKKS